MFSLLGRTPRSKLTAQRAVHRCTHWCWAVSESRVCENAYAMGVFRSGSHAAGEGGMRELVSCICLLSLEVLTTTIERWPFRTFTCVNRREPVRIWCEYANTRPLRPLDQSHTTSQMRFISACEYGANMVRTCENLGEHVRPGPEYACGATSR